MVPGEEYLLKYGDPRVESYPLMDNPKINICVIVVYFLFVKFIGLTWMKNREPYDLRRIMIIYNLLISALSVWMFLNFGVYGWFTKYRFRCEPIDFSDNRDAVKMVQVCWVFYASKLVELSDTVFAVLRKKDSQVSALHVFHHCFAPFTIWYAVKYGPGGYNTIFMMLNTFVHIWMYLYYGLAAVGPQMQKYLWWKKYLTTLQLIQFTVAVLYMSQLYLFPPAYCKVSTFLIWINLSNGVIFFVLFMNFYNTTYKKKKPV